jgi:hypothetical protein
MAIRSVANASCSSCPGLKSQVLTAVVSSEQLCLKSDVMSPLYLSSEKYAQNDLVRRTCMAWF